MKKILFLMAVIIMTATLSAAKIYYMNGSSIQLSKQTHIDGAVTSSHDFSAIGEELFAKKEKEKTNGKMKIYFINNVPVISNSIMFWKGDLSVRKLSEKYNLTLQEIYPHSGLYKFRVDDFSSVETAQKIVENGDGYAFPNLIRKQTLFFNPAPVNDEYFNMQWHLKNTGQHMSMYNNELTTLKGADIKFEEAMTFIAENGIKLNQETKVAIVDSGVAKDHVDLKDHLDIGWNAVDKTQGGYPDTEDTSVIAAAMVSHGTNCAGVAAAIGNEIGVSGVCPWCKIYPVRFMDGTGGMVDDETYVDTFEKFVDDETISVVNCSFGAPANFGDIPAMPGELEAIGLFIEKGRAGKGGAVIFAAGNENADTSYNGLYKHVFTYDRNNDGTQEQSSVVAVAASTPWDTRASYSNFGAEIDIAAPSLAMSPLVGITTTSIPGKGDFYSDYTVRFSGTSAAAPVVTGFFGVLFSVNPDLTLEEAVAIMKNSADKINPDYGLYNTEGHSPKYGYGRLNLLKAVRLANGLTLCDETASGEEIPQNNIDDNCNGWVDEGEAGDVLDIMIGRACEEDADCVVKGFSTVEDVTCLKEYITYKYENGYCAFQPKNRTCPDGTKAFGAVKTSDYYCMKECGNEKACEREGYICTGENLGICQPECVEDTDCLAGSFCTSDGICKKIAGAGAPCASDDDCLDAHQCLTMVPGGYCLSYCANNNDVYCTEDAQCVHRKSAFGDNHLCLKRCESDDECRPGEESDYICHDLMGGKEGVCYRVCKQDADCNDPEAYCNEEKRCILKDDTAQPDDEQLDHSEVPDEEYVDDTQIDETSVDQDSNEPENSSSKNSGCSLLIGF